MIKGKIKMKAEICYTLTCKEKARISKVMCKKGL